MNFSSHHENRVTIDGVLFIVLSKGKRLTFLRYSAKQMSQQHYLNVNAMKANCVQQVKDLLLHSVLF